MCQNSFAILFSTKEIIVTDYPVKLQWMLRVSMGISFATGICAEIFCFSYFFSLLETGTPWWVVLILLLLSTAVMPMVAILLHDHISEPYLVSKYHKHDDDTHSISGDTT